MHRLRCLPSEDSITFGKLLPLTVLPEDRWEKFYTFFRLTNTIYSWKLFSVTLLPEDQSFSFLIWAVLTAPPPSLRARANPQTQLMKLLWLRQSRKILDKNNLGEQKRAWWSNVSSYSGARVEPGCRGTESFTSCPFVVFHHRLQLYCAAPFPSEPQKEKPCMNIKKKHDSSYLCRLTNYAFCLARWRGNVTPSISCFFFKDADVI